MKLLMNLIGSSVRMHTTLAGKPSAPQSNITNNVKKVAEKIMESKYTERVLIGTWLSLGTYYFYKNFSDDTSTMHPEFKAETDRAKREVEAEWRKQWVLSQRKN